MAKRHHNPNPQVESIPSLLREADDCLRVSRKHRQPLEGNSCYAQKFLELNAKGVLLANDLQQQLANTDNKEVQGSADEIASLVTTFFTPHLDSKERTEIRKKISFLYKTSIEPALGIARPHIPKGKLFPLEILQGTRDHIERIGQQANGCYEQGWYHACAIMLRRLLETLIIECYEHHKIDGTIKGGEGNFLQLRDLIARFLNEKQWNPTRNTRNGLPKAATS